MKRRFAGFAWAVVVAFIVQQYAVALPLAVASWNARKPIICDMVGMPYGAWADCLTWVSMERWGAQ